MSKQRITHDLSGVVLACAVLIMPACSGKSVVDEPISTSTASSSASSSGSSTSSSSTSSSGTTSSSSTSSSGTTSKDCEQLVAEYLQAVEQARDCNPAVSSLQCTAQVDDAVICSCPTFVNPANGQALNDMAALNLAFDQQGCGDLIDCPPQACPDLQGGHCIPQGSASGSCEDVLVD